jgi:DNA-binding LytR/AlgR family response regulator
MRLLENGDRHMREVVKAACEELPPPMQPVVPASAKREQATAIFGKKEVDETVEHSDECTREPLHGGFRQGGAGRSTSPGKALPQTRTLALGKSARIAIKAKGKILFIDAADLIAVEAKGNYVLLLHTSGSHLLHESISTIEEKLNLHGFVRIHRSVLVNAALVEEIHPCPTGEYALRVRGGREFTVTRTYKKNLQLLAQLWIGMEGFAAE